MTLVNLRAARKAKARAAAAEKAAANRLRFGASKAERNHAAASEALERRRFEAGKRDPDGRDE